MDPPERVELPTAFEEAHIDHLALLIADMLDRLMAYNDHIPLLPESLTRFHSRSSPSISVLDYLRRIIRFTNVEKSCLLIILHYIDRICARRPLFTLSSLTCHRFVIASITVASKGLCDAFYSNRTYARVGGISVNELNMLEREFLQAIDWRLMCTREILQEYYVSLVRTHSTGQFIISGTSSSESVSSDSDTDMVDSGTSPPQSPSTDAPTPGSLPPLSPAAPAPTRLRTSWHRASTSPNAADSAVDGIDRRPTIEQNMAFAALRESLARSTEE